jgi:zinc transport system substrate-binding protein
LPFEQAWVPKLKRNYPELELIDSSAGIVRSEWHTHQHANEHQYFFDPHVWTSPENGLQIARSIAQALVRVDPTHAAEYERNFEQLKARLEAVDTTLRTLLSRRTARRFYVFHPAWGYFATAYGLEQVALEQEGRAPGLRRLKMLIEQARADRVRCIFVQEQYSRKTAQTFADAVNAEIAEADTLAYDYPASLIHFAEQLAGINSETCGAK